AGGLGGLPGPRAVVRRPAALLIAAYGLALAYFLVAPALPDVGGAGDLNTAVSDVPATFLLASCVLVLVPARDDWAALALIVAGAGLLAGGGTVAGSAPLAGVTKATVAGAAGALLAALPATVGIQLAVDTTVPAIPVLAAALLLPNLDRLPALARRLGERPA